jgi:hypothetical protein
MLSAPSFPGIDTGQLERSDVQPFTRGLLAIDIAEHHLVPPGSKVAGQIGGQCAFAGAALGIGDEKGFHA